MAFGDEKDDFPSELKNPPRLKVYKRPERKNTALLSKDDDFFIKESLKSLAWKQDEKASEIVEQVLKSVSFKNADFGRLDFSGAPLAGAKMLSCSFMDALLVAADLHNADLNHSDFRGANLTGANFSAADLSYADLTGANLSAAVFDGANLTGAKMDLIVVSDTTGFGGVIADAPVQKNIDKVMLLQEAAERGELDLRTLGIVDLRKLDLRSINLKGVYLKDKDLKGKLSGVNLSGAIINDSDIMGADINMLHFWVNNINETNEKVDLNNALKKEETLQKEEKNYQECSQKEKDALNLENKEKEFKEKELSDYRKMLSALHKKNKSVSNNKVKRRIKPLKGKIIS